MHLKITFNKYAKCKERGLVSIWATKSSLATNSRQWSKKKKLIWGRNSLHFQN